MEEANPKAGIEQDEIEVKLVPKFSPDTPAFYCNYAVVRHSPHEFTISAVDIRNITKEAIQDGKIDITPDIDLIVPPRVMVALRKALDEQIRKYQDEYGETQQRTRQWICRRMLKCLFRFHPV